jgi:hypothetical protein
MSLEPAPATGDPQHLLATTRELTRHVRHLQRGGWFPLLVFTAVTFAAIAFDRYGRHAAAHCTSLQGGGYVCAGYSPLTLWYWPVALLLAYVAISGFYLHQARLRGVGTRVQPYVLVGVLLALLATAWALWSTAHLGFLAESLHLGYSQPTDFLNRIASPAGAIGLALLLLAWIERSWLLLAITAVYLIIVVATIRLGGITHPTPWAFLPHVLLEGGVLLLGGAALALTQRPRGPSAA